MKKVTFNKASVCIMYVMVIGLPVVCAMKGSWAPDCFIYCWFGFWVVQAVVTARLQIDKRKSRQADKLLDRAAEYITEDNAVKLIEKYTGVSLEKGEKDVTEVKE